MAFSYKLGPGELSSRAAPPVPFSLAEASGREAYREWRVQAESYAITQGKLRVIEESVRDQLIASLGTSIRTAGLNATRLQICLLVIHFLETVFDSI